MSEKLPPEPEYRDGSWWYKGGKYYKTEAFREYGDDRDIALRARIVALVPHAKHIGSCRDNIIGGYDYPCSCGLTALLAQLRDEKLIP